MDLQLQYEKLADSLATLLPPESVQKIRYLCSDIIPCWRILPGALFLFRYFESMNLIDPSDLSFLAVVFYRTGCYHLLKLLPGVKNVRDYEENFLPHQRAVFSPYRIACVKVVNELDSSDLVTLRRMCFGKLSDQSSRSSTDPVSLLVSLEAQKLMSHDDLSFILSCFRELRNQVPFRIFEELKHDDTSFTEASHYGMGCDHACCFEVTHQAASTPPTFTSTNLTLNPDVSTQNVTCLPITKCSHQAISEHSSSASLNQETSLRHSLKQFLPNGESMCSYFGSSAATSLDSIMKLKSEQFRDRNGHCFIVNNLHNQDSSSCVVKIRSTFLRLGFTVEVYTELISSAIVNVFKQHSSLDQESYDCLIAVVLAPGEKGCIYGRDKKKVEISCIENMFRPENCQSFYTAPKLFFYQNVVERAMCGSLFDHAPVSSNVAKSNQSAPFFLEHTPNEADFFLGYSTSPGFLSYRSKMFGSWYINSVVDHLERHHTAEDFISIMIKVNADISQKERIQMPIPIPMLRKKLYFTRRSASRTSTSSSSFSAQPSTYMRGPLESYDMDSPVTGVCLIINNIKFATGDGNSGDQLSDREGAHQGIARFADLFKSFGFDINSYENLDSCEMLDAFGKVSQADHTGCDCLVTLLSSHGDQGCVYGTDGLAVRVSQIQALFKPKSCPSLINKPKLIFINACQGKRPMHGYSLAGSVCTGDRSSSASHASTSRAFAEDTATDSLDITTKRISHRVGCLQET